VKKERKKERNGGLDNMRWTGVEEEKDFGK